MQHQVKKRTLSRTRRQRTALLRGLATDLITKGKLVTTTAKARELRPFAERLITYGKRNTIASRRQAATALGEPRDQVIRTLFEDVATKYQDREGGYTRVIKMGRTAAGRDEAVIELV